MDPALTMVAILGSLVTAGLTWGIARRTASGRVDTSAADQLWTESKTIRQELRDEAVALRLEASSLRTEVAILRAEVATCHTEAVRLRMEITELHKARPEPQRGLS